jgi:protein involved in polysaccharide export with SLBB domain
MHQTWKPARLLPTLLGTFICLVLFSPGCGRATHADPLLETQWTPSDAVPALVLQPGDGIEIKFQEATDMDDRQTIRPDGRISMPMIGEIVAAGQTPAQLTDLLNEKFSADLQNPRITVIVRSLEGRRIFVGGQVKNQGVYLLTTPTSIYDGILMAGGVIDESAQDKKVAVVRYADGRKNVYVFNLHCADSIATFYLQPRDLVFVPKRGITKVDEWIDDYINKIIPHLPFYFDLPISTGINIK